MQHFGIVRSYGRWVMQGEYEFDDSIDTIDDFENQYYNDIHGLSLDALMCWNKRTLHILILTLNNQMRKKKRFYKLLGNIE